MRASITFGKILGIPIQAHSSWFLVLALATWSLALGFFPAEYPGWAAGTYWLVGTATSLLFFGSVVVHELSHSLVALRSGVPVRGITLFIFGGVSQIEREPPTAGAEFRIAIAGPLTSLGLAALFALLGAATAAATGPAQPLAALALYLARINAIVALFNLLPGFPLDGGRLLRAALWGLGSSFRTATRWASMVGHVVAFVFILFGVSQIFFGNFFNGLWVAFIGWFLNNAAEASYQQVVLRDLLAGVKARDLMTQEYSLVGGDLPLDRLVHAHVLGKGGRCFFVADDGALRGLITLHNIKAVPRSDWETVTANQIMTPASSVASARPEEGVLALLQRMDEAVVNQLPVMEAGRLLGVVTREQLLHYIRARSELGV